MSDIKLFGKVIHLGSDFKEDCEYECTSSDDHHHLEQSKNRAPAEKILREFEPNTKQERQSSSSCVPETPPSQSSNTGNPETLSTDKGCSSDDKEDSSDRRSSNDSQDQNSPPQKPDKITPCPRCCSINTKFCYFNNYNVNQLRHFCKDCQRYWTAGGTMRNVPVGSGRRKNKGSWGSHYRHLLNPAAGMINGTVLSFSQDSYPAESGAAIKTNGFVEKRGNEKLVAVQPQGAFLQGSPWAYSCNLMPLRPGFPVPFHAAQTQWACNSVGSLNLQCHSPHSDQSSSSCSPNSASPPRKHSRDGTMLLFGPSDSDTNLNEAENAENVRVPVLKISRIDDPIEAANSSIWSTIRSKNSHVTSNAKGGFFGGLDQFNGIGNEMSNPNAEESSMALQLNPAAFSRSLTFHEIAR